MTYEEYKKEVRAEYPTASNRFIREAYSMEHPYKECLADTPPPATTGMKTVAYEEPNQKEEGINPMNFDECVPCKAYGADAKFGFKTKAAVANAQIINAVPVEATQRDYAIERIKAIGEKHAQALRTQFNMNTVNPQTFLELEALIKAGGYTVFDKAKDEDAYMYNLLYGVKFGKPADKDGYEAAKAVLKVAAQKALDKATLGTIDTLEGTIDGFEAWTL